MTQKDKSLKTAELRRLQAEIARVKTTMVVPRYSEDLKVRCVNWLQKNGLGPNRGKEYLGLAYETIQAWLMRSEYSSGATSRPREEELRNLSNQAELEREFTAKNKEDSLPRYLPSERGEAQVRVLTVVQDEPSVETEGMRRKNASAELVRLPMSSAQGVVEVRVGQKVTLSVPFDVINLAFLKLLAEV